MLRILHTSDWHLGRQLYGQNRHAEFQAFLNWLQNTMREQRTEVLLVAGDVFDTTTPNHAAQEMYYRFLADIAAKKICRHVIIIGGNHDSATFLNAPKALLNALNIRVMGACTQDLTDEVLVLDDEHGQARAIVCAVPYLRDKDVRLSLEGQSITDKQQALLTGIRQHYQNIYQHAHRVRQSLDANIPIIAMGHLFTQGGRTVDADGVRELYVGTLAHIGTDAFDGFDYVALGHLHVPQNVGGFDHIRYCGSPIAMGFGEAAQQKQVLSIAWNGTSPQIEALPVPIFHALKRIAGDETHIQQQLRTLIQDAQAVYVEVVYQGNHVLVDLANQLHDMVANTAVSILRVYNRQFLPQTFASDTAATWTLPDLTPTQVFETYLGQQDIDDTQKDSLRLSYQTVLQQLEQQDDAS